MKAEYEGSTTEMLLQGFDTIWSAAGEATKLQEELNVRSLEETATAAERAGCEVCYADLPEKVSGFAEIIEGKAHIVLNRAKSPLNLQYTLPHELGHCVLHLDASRDAGRPRLAPKGAAEFEAHLFAASWVTHSGNGQQSREVLAANPESLATILGAFMLTLALIVIAIIAWVCSKLFSTKPLALPDAK